MTMDFRTILLYREGYSVVDFSNGSVYWTNTRIIIKDDPNLERCIEMMDPKISESDKDKTFSVKFRRNTKDYCGLELLPIDPLCLRLFNYIHEESIKGKKLNEREVLPVEGYGSERIIGLFSQKDIGYKVNADYHSYIKETLNPEKIIARKSTNFCFYMHPHIAYIKGGKVCAVLMPLKFGLGPDKAELPVSKVESELFRR